MTMNVTLFCQPSCLAVLSSRHEETWRSLSTHSHYLLKQLHSDRCFTYCGWFSIISIRLPYVWIQAHIHAFSFICMHAYMIFICVLLRMHSILHTITHVCIPGCMHACIIIIIDIHVSLSFARVCSQYVHDVLLAADLARFLRSLEPAGTTFVAQRRLSAGCLPAFPLHGEKSSHLWTATYIYIYIYMYNSINK